MHPNAGQCQQESAGPMDPKGEYVPGQQGLCPSSVTFMNFSPKPLSLYQETSKLSSPV